MTREDAIKAVLDKRIDILFKIIASKDLKDADRLFYETRLGDYLEFRSMLNEPIESIMVELE